MKCPHCNTGIHPKNSRTSIPSDALGNWIYSHNMCPSCNKFFLILELTPTGTDKRFEYLVYPRVSGRSPCPSDVPTEYSEDYNEACLVLNDSPKATAALSRRCLQLLLREKAGVTHSNLYNEIEEFINRDSTPSHIGDGLHDLREIGNFAAHPTKSERSGEIFPVEPGEAEWGLDILESLFDYFFVHPKRLEERKNKLQSKLSEAE